MQEIADEFVTNAYNVDHFCTGTKTVALILICSLMKWCYPWKHIYMHMTSSFSLACGSVDVRTLYIEEVPGNGRSFEIGLVIYKYKYANILLFFFICTIKRNPH